MAIWLFLAQAVGVGGTASANIVSSPQIAAKSVASTLEYETTFFFPSSPAENCLLVSDAILITAVRTTTCVPVGCREINPSFSVANTTTGALLGPLTFNFTEVGNGTANQTLISGGGVNNGNQSEVVQSNGYFWAYTLCYGEAQYLPQGNLLISMFADPGCPATGDAANPVSFTQYTKGCIMSPIFHWYTLSFEVFCDAAEYFIIGYADGLCQQATQSPIAHQNMGCFPGRHPEQGVLSYSNVCQSPGLPGTSSAAFELTVPSLPQILTFAVLTAFIGITAFF